MSVLHRIPVKGQGIVEMECFNHPWCPGCVLERAERLLSGTLTESDKEQVKASSLSPTQEQLDDMGKKWQNKKLIR